MNKVLLILSLLLLFQNANGQTAFAKARQQYRAYQYSKALAQLSIVYNKDSMSARLEKLRMIADCYEKLKQYAEAEHWYEKICSGKQTDPEDSYRYAVLLKQNGSYEKAVVYFNQYAQLKGVKNIADDVNACREAQRLLGKPSGWLVRNESLLNSPSNDLGAIAVGQGYLFASDRQMDLAEQQYKWSGNAFLKIVQANKNELGTYSFMPMRSAVIGMPMHEGPVALSRRADTVYYTANIDSGTSRKRKSPKPEEPPALYNGIYYVTATQLGWSDAVSFPFNNTWQYHIQHPALSSRGDRLVFASDKPGGYGKMDLYETVWKDGAWSAPRNLGAAVNSSDDEVFPTFDNDDRLYFSSNRSSGMGGLDLYECNDAKQADTSAVILTRLPPPFNSPADDFFVSWNDDHTRAMLSSNRSGGMGMDDIYTLEKREPVQLQVSFVMPRNSLFKQKDTWLDVEDEQTGRISGYVVKNDSMLLTLTEGAGYHIVGLRAGTRKHKIGERLVVTESSPRMIRRRYVLPVVTLKGTVADHATGANIKEAKVSIVPREDTLRAIAFNADHTGRFEATLEPDTWYMLSVSKPGTTATATYDIIVPPVKNDTVIVLAAQIRIAKPKPAPPKKGEKFVFRNIYFAYNSAELSDSSAGDLNRMADYLKQHADVVAEISAHTDSRGKDAYNQQLSERRAISVRMALVQRGVPSQQLTAKGYGETQLLNTCRNGVACSEQLHAVNRRIEMKIIRILGTSAM